MTRPICPACGKPCQRDGCRPCRFDSDGPIPTIAEALSGKCEPYTASEVRLDLYARAVHDRARRELARELRRRLKLSIATWETEREMAMADRTIPASQRREEAGECAVYSRALDDVLDLLDRAMRATRGR